MLKIDYSKNKVILQNNGEIREIPFSSPEAFHLVAKAFLRLGWDHKYVYSFTWLGRPIIQLPDDIIRAQEAIVQTKPDIIVETGVAHGGSLVFYASLLKLIGGRKVIGVDIEIRPHNRKALEEHFLKEKIELIEGDSVDPDVYAKVKSLISAKDRVMVVLDSNHTKEHVLEELRLYSTLVTSDNYLVVADGILEDLEGAPRSKVGWSWNNPKAALEEFLERDKQWRQVRQPIPFNEGTIKEPVTYWKEGWLQRKK